MAIVWQSEAMPARKKPKSELMAEQVRVPMTAAQKHQLEAAAKREGLPVATWLRVLGLKAAQRSLSQDKSRSN